MNTIKLDTPIKRGETEITEVTVRKPLAGELRGIALTGLIQMDVAALAKVLPRLPMQAGIMVSGFLLPNASKPDASPA